MKDRDDAAPYLTAHTQLEALFNEMYEEQLTAECKTEKQKEVRRRMRKLKLRLVEGGLS